MTQVLTFEQFKAARSVSDVYINQHYIVDRKLIASYIRELNGTQPNGCILPVLKVPFSSPIGFEILVNLDQTPLVAVYSDPPSIDTRQFTVAGEKIYFRSVEGSPSYPFWGAVNGLELKGAIFWGTDKLESVYPARETKANEEALALAKQILIYCSRQNWDAGLVDRHTEVYREEIAARYG